MDLQTEIILIVIFGIAAVTALEGMGKKFAYKATKLEEDVLVRYYRKKKVKRDSFWVFSAFCIIIARLGCILIGAYLIFALDIPKRFY